MKGKKHHDKRDAIRDRDLKREADREMRSRRQFESRASPVGWPTDTDLARTLRRVARTSTRCIALDQACFEPDIAYTRGQLRDLLSASPRGRPRRGGRRRLAGFAIGHRTGGRGHVVTLDVAGGQPPAGRRPRAARGAGRGLEPPGRGRSASRSTSATPERSGSTSAWAFARPAGSAATTATGWTGWRWSGRRDRARTSESGPRRRAPQDDRALRRAVSSPRRRGAAVALASWRRRPRCPCARNFSNASAGSGRESRKPCSWSQSWLRQELELLLGLDALRDDDELEAAPHRDDRHRDGGVVLVAGKVTDEGLVELDAVDREALQVVERGVAGSEVVHRDADALLLEALQGVDRVLGVLHGAGLRDLQVELVGARARSPPARG